MLDDAVEVALLPVGQAGEVELEPDMPDRIGRPARQRTRALFTLQPAGLEELRQAQRAAQPGTVVDAQTGEFVGCVVRPGGAHRGRDLRGRHRGRRAALAQREHLAFLASPGPPSAKTELVCPCCCVVHGASV
jgi:hypothetical protein